MQQSVRNGAIYEFDSFRLVPCEELLLRNGEQVALNAKAFHVLTVLVERCGHLVEKSEILDVVWEDVSVEEGSLPKAIWYVRNALGDTSKERFIQTVPRRGYRFIYPVSVVTGSSAQQLHFQPRYRTRRSWAYAAIAVLFVVGVTLYLGLGGPGILRKGGVTRVAVLPLTAVEAQTDNAGYEFGIPEALILKLAADKMVAVRQLSAVRGYATLAKDPIEAGREQDVDYVLSGNYQVANGKIRVTAQLFDVATGKVTSTFTSAHETGSSFAAQDAIANNIGNQLLARFGSATTEFKSKRGTSNEDAYSNYQQAMTLLDQQRPGSIEKAREYLDRAVALDPNYARGWAGKAYAYSIMWGPGRPSDPEDPAQKYEISTRAAKRALAIDPDLSEAYTSLCENKFAYEFNFDEAEKDCKRAIDLDPDSPLGHRLYSMLLTSRGRYDESFAEIRTAMELEPASLRNQLIFADGLYYARRYEEAIEVYKRLLDLNPEARATYLYLIRSLERSEREAEAFDFLIKLLILEKKDDATIERFKTAYASSGWQGVLNERINTELGEKSPQYSVVAEYYGLLGEKEKAFEYLDKNSQKRGWMKMFFGADPRFDPLRDDPRFDKLIKQIERNNV